MELTPKFNDAFQFLLTLEGKTFAAKDIDAGAVRYGLTERFLRETGLFPADADYAEILQDMSEPEAAEIYFQYWWAPFRFEDFSSPQSAKVVFASVVNVGPQAAGWLQEALWHYGYYKGKLDGVIGPKTLAAMAPNTPNSYMGEFFAILTNYYRGLAQKNPAKFAPSLSGWLARVGKLRELLG